MNSIPAPREDHDGTTFERHYRIAELAEFWASGLSGGHVLFRERLKAQLKPVTWRARYPPFGECGPFRHRRAGHHFWGAHFMPSVVKAIASGNALAECRRRCKELQAEGRKTAKRYMQTFGKTLAFWAAGRTHGRLCECYGAHQRASRRIDPDQKTLTRLQRSAAEPPPLVLSGVTARRVVMRGRACNTGGTDGGKLNDP